MIDDFGCEVPFEQLDPCCQKEVVNRQRHNEVTSILRATDRSQVRLDLLNNTWSKGTCSCCSTSQDYRLLATLRAQEIDELERSNRSETPRTKGDKDVCIDSDDDSLDDDDFKSEYELEQARRFEEHRLDLIRAQSMGLGRHVEDSLERISADISSSSMQGTIPTVVHVFNPSVVACGAMDLLLEKLSEKYLGTRFRRVAYSMDLSSQQLWSSVGVHNSSHSSSDGCLLCFAHKRLNTMTLSFDDFTCGDMLLPEEVIKFLHNSKVLCVQLPLILPPPVGVTNRSGSLEKEGVEAESYCDDPDCTKRYAHEHIGVRVAGSGSSIFRSGRGLDASGQEVFARNELLRL
jgi:hypothetical protein